MVRKAEEPRPDERRECDAETLGKIVDAGRVAASAAEETWRGLVRAIAGGDQHALQALYARSHRLVFTVIVRIVDNHATAEELTVDVFHEVWRRAAAYDPAAGPVVGWILNQARSRAIDRLRFEQRKKRGGASAEIPPAAPAERGPERTFEVTEQGRILRRALACLTPDQRQAIETAYFSEMTYEETATRLRQPVGTIKTRIRAGLGKLRQALRAS